MKTRVKYHKITDTMLVTDWFTVRPNYIIRGKILLNKKYIYYTIEEYDGSIVVTGGSNKLRTCKDRVKANLVDCGVIFTDEIRRHTTP